MQINLHLANAKKIFTTADCDKIHRGIERAKQYTTSQLNFPDDIDIVVTPNLPDFLIPEDHLGAFTYNGNFILLSFEQNHIKEDLIYEVTCHELCHAARWQNNSEDMSCLFDGMILEGLAISFEAKATKNQSTKQFFLQTVLNRPDATNRQILQILAPQLDQKYYDSYSTFIAGDKKQNLPRWSGYSAGYYLVQKYLAITSKTIEEVYASPYQDFRLALDEK